MAYLDKKLEKMSKSRKLIFIALLLSQALVLSFIERSIPFNFGVPGAKLGLANIIVLTSLIVLSLKEAFTLLILRCGLFTLIAAAFSTFLYSLSGGVFSFFAMYLLLKMGREKISIIGISVVGAIFHNLGQLLMAAFIIQNINIVVYLPMLAISGVVTGIVVGITVQYLLKALEKLPYFK